MDVDQVAYDLYGCEGPLDDVEALEHALEQAARAVGATVVARAQARFQPHGVTVVLVLAESHALIATWPEHRFAIVDVFLCNPAMDVEAALTVVSEALRPVTRLRRSMTHRIAERP